MLVTALARVVAVVWCEYWWGDVFLVRVKETPCHELYYKFSNATLVLQLSVTQ